MEKQKHEKRRKRKKKLLNSIREQIEFYFSDANLRHDRFMRQLVGAEDPEVNGRQSVDLKEFFKFNKISEMTKKLRDISLSLESSKCLSLDKNQMTVKRNEPFVQKNTNFDESTIYVERLPPNADQQWIRSVFGTFGRIEYIKIPYFRHNNNIMGFSFIEFSEPESAQKAVKHFNGLSSNEHKNIQTDEDMDQMSTSSQSDSKAKSDVSGKRTHESDAEEVIESKRRKLKVSDETEDKEKSETIEENNEINVKNKKKKKRKRKRKIAATVPTEDIEPEVINLRVMSKKEYKQWKNKYLKLQKQTMSSIKRSLLVENQDISAEKNEKQMTNVEENNGEDSIDRHFENGLIIKLNFSMPSKDMNEFEFKRNIRLIGGKNEIQYIDLPLNRLEFLPNQTVNGICFIRTNSSEDCKLLVDNQKLNQWGEVTVLEGNEEKDYWNQIFEQRIKKKSNKSLNKNKTKVRGFDRIINRAENVNTNVETRQTPPNKHIKFET